MSEPPTIVVVTGPTGVGKTHVALELARRFDGELVGADSIQIYRGFDIGSSKPTSSELAGIAHHLIDLREPEDVLDAASYAELAAVAIMDIGARGKLPIVVGGTGLWLRALLRGLVELPPVDRALRARLEGEWDERGGIAMHTQLAERDPLSAAKIHPNDKLRVVRALEVFAQTGRPLGAARNEHALGRARYRDYTIVLDIEPVHHRERVKARTRAMLEAGLVPEVAGLLERHGAVRALGSVGYKQVVEHLSLGVPLAETEIAIARATSLYARRQRTWWRSDPSVHKRITPQAVHDADVLREIEALRAR
jgi:tRNA dimethylallyltransferase